ncbi:pentatricopeptide repeat-containing protein At4g18975, chloroplastic-like isoform X1 [Chenopodium quinoa]|uniref:pentatricopeptide repeat-containing protein At4g18975, chloroplastic-like isoform X1 n=1 Tax=Chenopodium quinoa TaxID=63459 RepID=UPI000B778F53|nr:pentatricopeptide repeat-containing protein At4g18975, chloroplastic-like isoform X1 [Chenopodium quinoa]XP_021741400.1 pentatricopeptide repeat-containing protein At4g18975, chloroplastic-like isoform X1 [Chenopodium quinoa]XP_021741401.1 pentatricopeptide repeat-containing protein At4g18975, chloroplastic-like isoform X1 [Chenopodium quinoa]XP_021741402.1 pentatricopeptide repeat-containing protein At4g18975, chloroplastic-like isoform X1 [Chenopodium quinoa]
MLRLAARYVLNHSSQFGRVRCQAPKMWFSTMAQAESQVTSDEIGKENNYDHNLFLGQKISRKEKMKFLTKTLFDLEDSKDAIYGTLDAWVAWEQNFPIAALKNVLLVLQKEQQWHRVVQVLKWMLSKGQGNTVGTYQQLIRALDMDHRAEEAHNIWMKKIGNNLHSVPWPACHLMISIYHRNNMLEGLIKLFKRLEAFHRKPPEKSIVQKVADAYELLGLVDDKEKLLEKYADLLNKTREESKLKSNRVKTGKKKTLTGRKSSLANGAKA